MDVAILENHFVIPPTGAWTRLDDPDELLLFLKKYELTPETATAPRQLYHIDISGDVRPCKVVGYISQWNTVIEVDGKLGCIDPRYLREMNSSARYCVFDVETPNAQNDRISAIGLVLFDGEKPIHTAEYLVNPEVPFDSYNVKLTGIDAETVKDAPKFPEVWEQIKDLISGSVLVAHNALFDLSVLYKTLLAYQITPPDFRYLCTLQLARAALPELGHYKLNDLCRYYHIELDHHKAGSDALACAQILGCLIAGGVQAARNVKQYKPEKETKMGFKKAENSQKELVQLLSTITADEYLTLEELEQVKKWLDGHVELAENEPFCRAYFVLQQSLTSGYISQDKQQELLTLFQTVSDPVECLCVDEPVESLDGKIVCITGDFLAYGRKDVERLLKELGAILKSSPTRKTDYLIVGAKGSEAWCAGNYGTKVKKTLELQGKGYPIKIIKESCVAELLNGRKEHV